MSEDERVEPTPMATFAAPFADDGFQITPEMVERVVAVMELDVSEDEDPTPCPACGDPECDFDCEGDYDEEFGE
jgi:hypothetical protein